MTREVLVSLSPGEVVETAKDYFTDPKSGYSASVLEEGDGYVRFQTFRGWLSVSAQSDGSRTRVRCSTLRHHPSLGKFLLALKTAPETGRA